MDHETFGQEPKTEPVDTKAEPSAESVTGKVEDTTPEFKSSSDRVEYNKPSNSDKNPKFTQYLIFSIIELVCVNQICGIIALILTCMADSDFKSGNMDSYDQKMSYAKIALIVGLALLVVVIPFVFCVGCGMFSGYGTTYY